MLKVSNWSLLKRSLFWLNLLSIALIISAFFLGIRSIEKQNRSALDLKVNSLSDFVKHAAANAVWNFDSELLKKFSVELIKDTDVVAVEFFDKDKKTIQASKKDESASAEVERPILDPKGETTIGFAKIMYTDLNIRQEQKRMTWNMVFFCLGFQLLLSLGIYLFLGKSSKRLEQSVNMLKETAVQAKETGAHLKKLSENISEKGAVQAAAIEETSATLTELTSILSKTVDASNHASEMSNSSYESAQKGKVGNEALLQAMREISEGAAKIREITGVVDDIAFQTNLLALNAAVEAARAGEQGRGFAVVAEAVRTLAQKSAVAAKDISHLITESTARVENGMSLVESNSKIFNEILSSVEELKSMNESLAQNSQEQSAGITQISKAVIEIDRGINESAQSTMETAKEADQMAQQSEFLNDIVFTFEKEIKGAA